MKRNFCDKCKKEDIRLKHLKKINGKWFCKKCYQENKKNHRKETIETSGIKRELKRLDNKINYTYRKIKENIIPKIKSYKKNERNNLYLTLEEKRNLFRILVKRGLDTEDAKDRIKELIKSQKTLRERMLKSNKTEEEIKLKQQKLLEELWNY